jgi:hypothetical protein
MRPDFTDQSETSRQAHARMLGNGLCTRPVELECRMESACETCAYSSCPSSCVNAITPASAVRANEPTSLKAWSAE